jgi:bacillopeptidase F
MKSGVFISAFAVFLLLAGTGYSHGGKIKPNLKTAIESVDTSYDIPVIVYFSDKVDLGHFKSTDKKRKRARLVKALKNKADSTQQPVADFLKSRGIKKVKKLWSINAMALEAPSQVIAELSRLDSVESIGMDYTITKPVEATGTSTTAEWNLNAIHALDLWHLGFMGNGVSVGIMDTGVDLNHPAYQGQWRGGTNSWYDPNGEHSTPYDAAGHGTQVTGLIAGGVYNDKAIGVAPSARWIAVKIFNDAGISSYSIIHQGFQWMLDPDGDSDTGDSPDIVNNSWGLDNINNCSLEFQPDIQVMRAAGIMTVFPAGNYGSSSFTSISPSNNPEALAAGAVDQSLAVASFSGRGPSACGDASYPEVAAPGVNVKTADLTSGGGYPDSYVIVSGTSYSTPHLTGALALLMEACPGVSVDKLESSILQSAHDAGEPGADNSYGYGIVDVKKAFDALGEDNDGDGSPFYADCNDGDPGIYPGVSEIKHDGIDQDCNGYDLTIDVIKAAYKLKSRGLSVEATSDLNENAALELVGYGPMKWKAKRLKWTLTVKRTANPGSVTVSGIEGADSVPTVQKK